MPGPDSPRRPTGPTVPPSEPEQERRALDKLVESTKDTDSRRYIGLHAVRDYLLTAGLDVDDDGFIIDEDTGEYATPYAHSPRAFQEIPSPVDDPFDAYYRPETEVMICIGAKDKLHVTDLHTITKVDGKHRPVQAHTITLSQMQADTGMAFNTVISWSDATDLVDSDAIPGQEIHLNHSGLSEKTISLNCLRCEFEGGPDEWDGEEDDPECPDCGGRWLSYGLEICTACQTTHWFEDMDWTGEGLHGEPRCPECGAGHRNLESQTRYNIQNMEFDDD